MNLKNTPWKANFCCVVDNAGVVVTTFVAGAVVHGDEAYDNAAAKLLAAAPEMHSLLVLIRESCGDVLAEKIDAVLSKVEAANEQE